MNMFCIVQCSYWVWNLNQPVPESVSVNVNEPYVPTCYLLLQSFCSGGQLPAGGTDQRREEQQIPGQSQGQYPQQGQGQYPQQGQGQPGQEVQGQQQQQGQYPQDAQQQLNNQQGLYQQDGQQQQQQQHEGAAPVQGQYNEPSTSPSPNRDTYREDDNYPPPPAGTSQINHHVAGNQGNIHPAFTTRAPRAASAAEGYQQQNGGYQQQNGGYQERNGYQQQKTVRPWAYTGSHIQHTGSRQDQNQAPQGQSNVGQGQVAGEGQSFGLERRRGEAPALQGQGNNNNMTAKNDCETNILLRLLLG